MHRSGTSAMARVVNLLGVFLGHDLRPPAPHNPRGLWEHKEIVDTHEEICRVLKRRWFSSLSPLPNNWWLFEEIVPLGQKIVQIVRRDFSESAAWGLKDPRLCRLLPLWMSVFRELNCKPCFLHVVRHPLEVSASIRRRDGLPTSMPILLWLQHVLDAERLTRGHPRVFVRFEQLLRDWRSTMERVAMTLDWQWSNSPETAAEEIEEFLCPGLKHHDSTEMSTNHPSKAVPWSIEAYAALYEATESNDMRLSAVLSRIHCDLDREMRSHLAKLLTEDLEQEVMSSMRVRVELKSVREQLNMVRSDLHEVLHSRSWKITRPLRYCLDMWNRTVGGPSKK